MIYAPLKCQKPKTKLEFQSIFVVKASPFRVPFWFRISSKTCGLMLKLGHLRLKKVSENDCPWRFLSTCWKRQIRTSFVESLFVLNVFSMLHRRSGDASRKKYKKQQRKSFEASKSWFVVHCFQLCQNSRLCSTGIQFDEKVGASFVVCRKKDVCEYLKLVSSYLFPAPSQHLLLKS